MSSPLPESEQGSGSSPAPPLDIADLFRELQETNRLLREIVSQKAVNENAATAELLSPRLNDEGPPLGSPVEASVVSAKTIQLVDDLAHRVFDSGHREHLHWFRDLTLSRISKLEESSRDPDNVIQPQHQARVFLSMSDSPSRRSKQPLELRWDWRISSRIPRLPLTDGELENLRAQWLVEFDLDRLTERVSRHSGWILGRDLRRNGMLCACPLVYGPGDVLAPANSILDECHKAKTLVNKMAYPTLVSPGAIW
jgi:hypothetical protein